MTHEEAMEDDFQVPNGFLPSDKKQSTMTHNTQGGIARWVKHLGQEVTFGYEQHKKKGFIEGYHPTWGVVLFVPTNIMVPYHYVREELIEWPESPLPASPEGTWETEFEKLYAKKNYYNLVSFVKSIFQPLQQELSEHKRAIELISSQYQDRVKENERLNKVLSESIQTGEKAIERIGELEKQLAEAREAWKDAIIELKAAKAVYVGISIEHPKIKPQCDALIEGIDAVISKSSALK